jgi:Tol biopolymer transport system component
MFMSIVMGWMLLAQRPMEPAQSAEDVAREARHLKNIRQVTFGFDKAGEGYFSPDGREIVFQAVPHLAPAVFHTPKANEDAYQIFACALEPDAVPRLISTGKGRCTCAYFAPDRKRILFGSSHLDPKVDDVAPPRGPAYSRSDRYKWEFPEAMEIFEADLDGQNLVRLTDAPGYDAEGSYSPDGKSIVFTSFRDGDAEIYIMDADGKNPRRITRAKGYDGGPFFSPDGKRIIYRSDRQENDRLQLFVNNVEGTAERQLTSNEFVNWGPYWHPSGRHIIYATSKHGHQNYELYLMDVDSGAEERITFREGFDGLPVFSPDGKRLMWTSSGRTADRKSQLFLADFTLEPETNASR